MNIDDWHAREMNNIDVVKNQKSKIKNQKSEIKNQKSMFPH